MNHLFLVRTIFLSVLLLVFLFSPKSIFAASLNLQSNQNSLGQEDEYSVSATLSINVANGAQYFLRGVFYQSGTTNYCGYTWNGTDWFKGPYTTNNGWQNFLPITVNNSSWSGTIKAKVDTTDLGCTNSGAYGFKIERFTLSGSGSFDNQNDQTLIISLPTSTPTPAPTSKPTNTSTPSQITSTLFSPTSTTFPQSTIRPTAKPTSLITAPTIGSISAKNNASISGVLGVTSFVKPTLVDATADTRKQVINPLALFLILGGILLHSSCGILLFYQWKSYGNKDTNN